MAGLPAVVVVQLLPQRSRIAHVSDVARLVKPQAENCNQGRAHASRLLRLSNLPLRKPRSPQLQIRCLDAEVEPSNETTVVLVEQRAPARDDRAVSRLQNNYPSLLNEVKEGRERRDTPHFFLGADETPCGFSPGPEKHTTQRRRLVITRHCVVSPREANGPISPLQKAAPTWP